MQDSDFMIPVTVIGHCHIEDDLGNVLLDKTNAIHPQNMARIFSRALANEPNSFIHRIAFGNGGTVVDAAYTVTYRTPNDGQPPDISTWQSRLYNETYSEIIDDGLTTLNPLLGTDPGSADLNTGVRPGGGAVPSSDRETVIHTAGGPGVISNELGLQSEVIISAELNGDEPLGQYATDNNAPSEFTEADFVFDEIGLYTGGAPAIATNGYHNIDVGNRTSVDDSGLLPGTSYQFNITVDGGTFTTISFTTPSSGGSGAGGQILYGDLCQAINTGSTLWGFTGINPLPGNATVSITDTSGGSFSSISGSQTFGFLRVSSSTTGVTSAVDLNGAQTTNFIQQLNPPVGGTLMDMVTGSVAGWQNNPSNPSQERERLLAHLIFSPVLKASNRTLLITYTLTISVARSPS